MKRANRKTNGVVKGGPSGFVISLLIHAAAFLLAGMLVVFNVVKKEEKKFVPPKPVERPKMKLRKPKVQVKKNSKPKPSTRIVTKVKRANMPDIQLPEMSGMSGGLGGGIGGFEIMTGLDDITILGSSKSIGSDLEGTYYDLKLTRNGSLYSTDVESFRHALINFVDKGLKPSALSRYYRAPKQIYATCLLVPPTISSIAPAAFGDRDASGAQWLVHYKGKLVHREGITFRFWAAADETLLVRVDGEYVVGAKWANVDTGISNVEPDTVSPFWQSSSMQSYRFIMGNSRAAAGDWITLEPGVPLDMDIVIGDNGGQANFYLAVEEKGVEYPKSRQGGPILPAFKTAEISHDMQDIIYQGLVDGEISLTTGPIFNDYSSPASKVIESTPLEEERSIVADVEPEPAEEKDELAGQRIWTVNEKDVEAEFLTIMAGQAVFKTRRGKNIKVPLSDVSAEHREMIELSRPPKFDIDFVKNERQKTFVMESKDADNIRPPERRCHYGARLKQTSSGSYNYPLTVEFFAIGQERLGQTYILLDHQSSTFVPTRENKRSHEFLSEREVVLENFIVSDEPRGKSYATYLVTVTDQRGKVVAVSAGSSWLYENLENLRMLSPGNFMDENCIRTFPTQPPRTMY